MKKTADISLEGRKLRTRILNEYNIDDTAGLAILDTALKAYDRMRAAEKIINRDGLTVLDKWDQVKAHPLCSVERDSRAQFLQALKQLNLDLEPLRDGPGRPGGRH